MTMPHAYYCRYAVGLLVVVNISFPVVYSKRFGRSRKRMYIDAKRKSHIAVAVNDALGKTAKIWQRKFSLAKLPPPLVQVASRLPPTPPHPVPSKLQVPSCKGTRCIGSTEADMKKASRGPQPLLFSLCSCCFCWAKEYLLQGSGGWCGRSGVSYENAHSDLLWDGAARSSRRTWRERPVWPPCLRDPTPDLARPSHTPAVCILEALRQRHTGHQKGQTPERCLKGRKLWIRRWHRRRWHGSRAGASGDDPPARPLTPSPRGLAPAGPAAGHMALRFETGKEYLPSPWFRFAPSRPHKPVAHHRHTASVCQYKNS